MAFVAQVHVELLFLQLEVDVAFVGTFFAGFGIAGVPVHGEGTEEVFAAEGKVHGALAFQAGVAVVRRTGFGLYAYGGVAVGVKVFQRGTVAVLPVVAVVEDAFEGQFVVGIDVPVQCGRVALAFAGDVVLADLVVVDVRLAVVILLPYKFGVVGTRR